MNEGKRRTKKSVGYGRTERTERNSENGKRIKCRDMNGDVRNKVTLTGNVFLGLRPECSKKTVKNRKSGFWTFISFTQAIYYEVWVHSSDRGHSSNTQDDRWFAFAPGWTKLSITHGLEGQRPCGRQEKHWSEMKTPTSASPYNHCRAQTRIRPLLRCLIESSVQRILNG